MRKNKKTIKFATYAWQEASSELMKKMKDKRKELRKEKRGKTEAKGK